ncbi:MAG: hypothetical protein HYT73_01955 [Candidatus Aenigmarchaeota archaeon]|nr:hypothetical protein [Candidatus Aenigmarchaeota archaeon]
MTDIINPVTAAIISAAEDGNTIREVAMKTGFAYSAVYRWVMELAKHNIFELKDGGNRKRVYVKDAGGLYTQFSILVKSVCEAEKDAAFWNFIRKTSLNARFTGGTAVSLWTRGGYITGDFFDKIYMLEVAPEDLDKLKKRLDHYNIGYTEGDKSDSRPLIFLIPKKGFSSERIEGIPVMPLKELTEWCKKLDLDAVLEQLDALYGLGLKTKYSEVHTNV